jgi:hypothetical protein
LRQDAETVFGVVQNTIQAGAHKTYADNERKTANTYRYAAIFLMLSAVAILVLPEIIKFIRIEDIEKYFVDWDNLLKRLPISAVLFAPAFYLARESSKHRQNEFQNRRRELTLRTIDPYLALLKEETKKDELKGQIAQSIFGGNDNQPGVNSDASDVIAQVANLTNNLGKFIKGN